MKTNIGLCEIRLSLVIPVLNSHEIVRRQLLYFASMGLPSDVEVILVDDGSTPPLSANGTVVPYLRIVPTNDFRPWTQPLARNFGAKHATGEFLLMTDIDHIVPKRTIEWAMDMPYDYARFKREFGVLDEDGVFHQDIHILERYGFDTRRLPSRGLKLPCHTQSMVIRRSVFEATGGYPTDRATHYPTHDDGHMKGRIGRVARTRPVTKCPDDPGNDQREFIYMFPNGKYCGDVDYNPFGLFHDLTRKRSA